jgi:hypothetical protein
MDPKWKNIIWAAGPALIVILVLTCCLGSKGSAVGEGLVAWGTILLAYITYLTIKENIRLTDANLKQQQDRNQREHNTRRLDKIEQWAKDAIKYSALSSFSTQEDNALGELNVLASISANIINAVSSEEEELHRFVQQASDRLQDCINTWPYGYGGGIPEQHPRHPQLEKLPQAMRDVIDAITKRKLELMI